MKAEGRGFEPPTERLAIAQKINFVVNPLSYVCFELSTLETGGHVCQFQHPSV